MEERKEKDDRFADPNDRPLSFKIAGVWIILLVILIAYSTDRRWFVVMVVSIFLIGSTAVVIYFKSAGLNVKGRLVMPLLALVCLGFFIYYARDLPAAFQNRYLVAEGVPTKTEGAHRAKGGGIYGTYVTIQNHQFLLKGYLPEQVYDRYIIIHYYPHTGYQTKTEVLSYVETWKKTGKLK